MWHQKSGSVLLIGEEGMEGSRERVCASFLPLAVSHPQLPLLHGSLSAWLHLPTAEVN